MSTSPEHIPQPSDDERQNKHSFPVAVTKVYGKRALDAVRNMSEGLPAGYVRDNDTARVMAHWEDKDRSVAAHLRSDAAEQEQTGAIDHELMSIELSGPSTPEHVKELMLASDHRSRQASIRFQKAKANHMDKQAGKMGKTMRRHYEIAMERGTHSKEFFINQARVAKVNPIPRPHDR